MEQINTCILLFLVGMILVSYIRSRSQYSDFFSLKMLGFKYLNVTTEIKSRIIKVNDAKFFDVNADLKTSLKKRCEILKSIFEVYSVLIGMNEIDSNKQFTVIGSTISRQSSSNVDYRKF